MATLRQKNAKVILTFSFFPFEYIKNPNVMLVIALINPDIARSFDSYQIDAICIVEETGRISHHENLTF